MKSTLFFLLFFLSLTCFAQGSPSMSFGYIFNERATDVGSSNDHINQTLAFQAAMRNASVARRISYPVLINKSYSEQTPGIIRLSDHLTQQKLNSVYSEQDTIRVFSSTVQLGWDSKVRFEFNEQAAEFLKNEYDQSIEGGDFQKAVNIAERLRYSNKDDVKLKGFNNLGIFLPETVDKVIPSSLFTAIKLKAHRDSEIGQVERRLINDYQVFWAKNYSSIMSLDTMGLQYLAGATYLKMADESAADQPTQSKLYLKISKNLLDALNGFADGAYENLKVTVNSIPMLASSVAPYLASCHKPLVGCLAAGSFKLMINSPKIIGGIIAEYVKKIDLIKNGNTYARGFVGGQIVSDVIIGALSGGESLAEKNAIIEATQSFDRILVSAAKQDAKIAQTLAAISENAYVLSNEPAFINAPNKVKAAEMYYSLLTSKRPELQSNALNILKTAADSPQSFDLVTKIAISQRDPKNFAKYFNGVEDVKTITNIQAQLENNLKNVKLETSKGFRARIMPKSGVDANGNVFVNTASDVGKFHKGIKSSESRFGLGGPDGLEVMSWAIGDTEEEAVRVAKIESGVRNPNLKTENFVIMVEEYTINNSLVLNDSNVKALGFALSDFTKVNNNQSYLISNILGFISKKQNINAIESISAQDLTKNGKVLHVFGDLK